MQKVDFFDSKWYVEHTTDTIFFLFDKEDGDFVKLSIKEDYKLTSVNVHNPNAKNIMFLPVDHNLDIRKEDSNDLDSTCDYLLTVNGFEQIIFGEIKTGKKGWASDGMRQVKHTIDIFRANHDLNQWGKCRAYVSNWRKWNARTSTRCVEESFRSDTGGLRLYVKNEVHIEGEK